MAEPGKNVAPRDRKYGIRNLEPLRPPPDSESTASKREDEDETTVGSPARDPGSLERRRDLDDSRCGTGGSSARARRLACAVRERAVLNGCGRCDCATRSNRERDLVLDPHRETQSRPRVHGVGRRHQQSRGVHGEPVFGA